MGAASAFDPFLVLAARWVAFERARVARCVLSYRIRSRSWRLLCGVAGARIGAPVGSDGELRLLIGAVQELGSLEAAQLRQLSEGMQEWMVVQRLEANAELATLWEGVGYLAAAGNSFVYKVVGSQLLVVADPAERNWLPDPSSEMRARAYDLEFYGWITGAEQVRGLDGIAALEARMTKLPGEAFLQAA